MEPCSLAALTLPQAEVGLSSISGVSVALTPAASASARPQEQFLQALRPLVPTSQSSAAGGKRTTTHKYSAALPRPQPYWVIPQRGKFARVLHCHNAGGHLPSCCSNRAACYMSLDPVTPGQAEPYFLTALPGHATPKVLCTIPWTYTIIFYNSPRLTAPFRTRAPAPQA